MTASWVWIAMYIAMCGGALLVLGYLYQTIAQAREARQNVPPGRMVDVGGHKLHILCKGNPGGPTVVIEQGAGEPSLFWWVIQERVAEFASVCLYDRAGLGWSEPAVGGRTIEDRAAELHTLLVNAQVPGPYVLVAHSYGGWIVRVFARDHRNQVAGMVLVDTGEEGVYSQPEVLAFYSRLVVMSKALGLAARLGLLRVFRPSFLLPPGVPPAIRQIATSSSPRPHSFFAAADEVASLKRASWMSQPQALGTLGDLPLVVIDHGRPFPGPFRIVEKYWKEGQKRLAALSSNSVFIVAEKSSHMVHFDEPELVVDAIRPIVTAARSRSGYVAAEGTAVPAKL